MSKSKPLLHCYFWSNFVQTLFGWCKMTQILCQIFVFVKKVKYWVYSFHLSAKPPTTVVVVGQMGWIFLVVGQMGWMILRKEFKCEYWTMWLFLHIYICLKCLQNSPLCQLCQGRCNVMWCNMLCSYIFIMILLCLKCIYKIDLCATYVRVDGLGDVEQ